MSAQQIPATARGQARRVAMIDAARAVFLEQGYERTTLDMVIARAGGSRRTLYECFGDKAGLFRAVIEMHTADLLDQLEAVPLASAKPEQALTQIGRIYLSMVLSEDALGLYRLLVAEVPKFPELGETFYQGGPQKLRQHLMDYLKRQHMAGDLNIANPLLAARQFFGLIKSDHQMSALLCPSDNLACGGDLDAEVGAAVRLFLAGYSPTVT